MTDPTNVPESEIDKALDEDWPAKKSIEKLERENATLRDWIRSEGDRTDVCTYDVLREICDGCNCQRKRT